jgi:DNA polymerase-4
MKTILHVDMDAFFVSVEELVDPTLKGKAVVVGGKGTDRGVVSAASYEARKFGVHSAMPLRTASLLCPHAIFIEGHMRLYQQYSGKVEALLREFSPQVSMASVDEAYLDLTGCERLWGPPLSAGHRIHEAIAAATGLKCSIGIARSRLVAKIASDQAKRNGVLWVLPGTEANWLAPMPVKRIPGVGKVLEKELAEIGIKRIGDLARLDEQFLRKRFGQWGLALAGKARGEDAGAWFDDAIGVEEDPKSISHEHTFDTDTVDALQLRSTLLHLCERVMKRLRAHGLLARTVQLKLRFSGFETITRSRTLRDATDIDRDVIDAAVQLWQANWPVNRSVRLIGLQVAQLSRTTPQPNLLTGSEDAKWRQALKAADKLKDKFGENALNLGGALAGRYRDRVHEAAPKALPRKRDENG